MKNLLFLLAFLITGTVCSAQSQVVQIAAYDKKVSKDYFQGLSEVKYYTDYNGFVHYYVEATNGKSLSSVLSEAQGLGYSKSYILDLDELKACNTCCGTGRTDYGVIRPAIKPVQVYQKPAVVYNCDVPSFRVNNQEDMEKVRYVINQNPGSSLMMVDCPINDRLNCYLGVRGIQACGFGFYSFADLKKETGCSAACGMVYLKAADGNMIDINQTFDEIVSATR